MILGGKGVAAAAFTNEHFKAVGVNPKTTWDDNNDGTGRTSC
jgi:hypothetical protein